MNGGDMTNNSKLGEVLQHKFEYRLGLFLFFIAGSWLVVSPILAIIVAIASSTFEILYKIDGLKPKSFIKILNNENEVYNSLVNIVNTAKKGDTIYVSAQKSPTSIDRKNPNNHYSLINKRANEEGICLNRLVYINQFENDEEYKNRIDDLKDWIDKDKEEIGEKYFDVKYTKFPNFFLYMLLDSSDKCIFQMSIPPSLNYMGPLKQALYAEGDTNTFKSFCDEIKSYHTKGMNTM